jgi:hypothetical protein
MQFHHRCWAVAFFLATLAISASPANAQVCPVVGADTNCGIVITITDTGSSVSFTGQGPYDGIEDTLVGIVNNSSQAIRSVKLMSALPIFAFDGDGIDAYSVPGNVLDSTGYGGPNAYFTNINSSLTSGTINFVVPLAAGGGTGYFSLEEAISAAYSCPDVVNNSVKHAVIGGTTITATFTPQISGLSTSQAAQICGFTKFNWIQKVTNLPDPSPFYAVNPSDPSNPSADIHLISASTPFNDPYQNGYRYNPSWNSYPYYFDPNTTSQPWSLSNWDNGTTLSFRDTPTDPCLPGGNSTGVRGCNGLNAPAGSHLGFTTHLVGILADGSPVDLGIGFSWTDTYNGTSGGISTLGNLLLVDPGSGNGGITVTGVQDTTNYQYNGIVVTAVNGTPTGGETIPPAITVAATPSVLWPPNGKMVPVTVSGKIVDNEPGGTGVNQSTATYAVTDKYGRVQPMGAVILRPDGSYSFTIQLEASRNGNDKGGRQYIITVSAKDNAGNKGSSSASVIVVHDQRH